MQLDSLTSAHALGARTYDLVYMVCRSKIS